MLTDIYNYLALNETLSTSGQPDENQFAEIAQAGFQVVINLGVTGSDYALADEAGLVKGLGMAYIHLPVVWTDPQRIDLLSFFALMDAHREKKVYIHCAANMRVSAFVALYRINRLGWSHEAAFTDLQRIWEPNAVWRAFIHENMGIQD